MKRSVMIVFLVLLVTGCTGRMNIIKDIRQKKQAKTALDWSASSTILRIRAAGINYVFFVPIENVDIQVNRDNIQPATEFSELKDWCTDDASDGFSYLFQFNEAIIRVKTKAEKEEWLKRLRKQPR